MLAHLGLCQWGQDTAAGHCAGEAAWVRQAMRHMTLEEFPASGRAGGLSRRSHESGRNRRRLLVLQWYFGLKRIRGHQKFNGLYRTVKIFTLRNFKWLRVCATVVLGRLEHEAWHQLETLARVFACPAAGGIRQLIDQASFEDLPGSRSLARGARCKEDPHDDIPG
jgi:hypothetical protein